MDKTFKTSDIYMVRIARVEKIVRSPIVTTDNITYKKFPYTFYAKAKILSNLQREYEIFSNHATLKDINNNLKEGDLFVYLKVPINLLLKKTDKKTIKLSTLIKAEKELNSSPGVPLGTETPAQLAGMYDRKQEKVRQF